MQKQDKQYDVAIIGGGPSGMMAAGRAAERGAKVVLLEKNSTLGKKLLITGGGRCNVTNAEFDTRKLLSKFKGNDKFLFSAFSQWSVKETLEFFNSNGMETKVEAEQRVFPVSDSARSVWDVLVKYMRDGKVEIISNSPVSGFKKSGNKITAVRMKNGTEIKAKSFVLATGGKSRPETGSTGDGFEWLKEIGHTVVEQDSALVPVRIREQWVHKLSGISIGGARLTTFQNGQKQDSQKGKMLFTHFGISGPLVLNMSKDIGELLKYGEVIISIDLYPDLDITMLDAKIQDTFRKNQNKKFRNGLAEFIAPSMASVMVELSDINPGKFINRVGRKERLHLVELLKNLKITVQGLMGTDKAVVTSGGVKLEEVDFKTMRSRIFPNLYLIGDILNIDRPSGGYSLQLCWTTGFIAGNSIEIS